jgi:hypothetical protein
MYDFLDLIKHQLINKFVLYFWIYYKLNFNNKQTVMFRVNIFLFREKIKKLHMGRRITTNRHIDLKEKILIYHLGYHP